MSIRIRALQAALAAWMFCLAFWMGARPVAAAEKPRLVVVVSIDQFSYAYLERFRHNFSRDGLFLKLLDDGLVYANCHHAHAFTFTGPGHASLLTGTYPSRHGIVGNDWYDRGTGKDVNCVADKDAAIVGDDGAGGISPRNLLAPTVGDVMKLESAGRSKVFGIALKDRAAILMTGRSADGAFWRQKNLWVTSKYYRNDLPGYLRVLNESGIAKQQGGKEWSLLLDRSKYADHRPDDSPVENPPDGFGRTFPHKFAAGDDKKYEGQFNVSPFANELILLSAERLMQFEQLGQDEHPDLLAVGLSPNDLCGHAFDPYSLEVEDMTYRTDLLLGAFKRAIDAHMDGRPWLFVLTSDHGIAPNPAYAADRRLAAKANPLGKTEELRAKIDAALARRFPAPFGEKSYLLKFESNQVYLRRDQPALAGEHFVTAQQIVRDVLLEYTSVAAAATRNDLLAGLGETEMMKKFGRAFHHRRSGDVLFAMQPYFVHAGSSGTTHGAPWRYDSHIPLIFLGAGVKHETVNRKIYVAALAPTVSRLLGLPVPPATDEEALEEALAK
jgi:predicted AlkP superfamily pyrophosphatase or phosphodiesterase